MHRRSSTSLSTKGVWVCMALALVFQLTQSKSTSRPFVFHPLSIRSFEENQCKGVYDQSIYAHLDRICEDCYNLFKEPHLPGHCRKDCFKTPYFQACMEAFNLGEEETKRVYAFVKQVNEPSALEAFV